MILGKLKIGYVPLQRTTSGTSLGKTSRSVRLESQATKLKAVQGHGGIQALFQMLSTV